MPISKKLEKYKNNNKNPTKSAYPLNPTDFSLRKQQKCAMNCSFHQ